MNNRLAQFIQYKTKGNQAEFARLMGWKPQYLHRMLTDGSIGIRPIISLLEVFPELYARWLLLGEGSMISHSSDKVKQHLLKLLSIEKYMPVMTPDELREIQDGNVNFPEDTIKRWSELLSDRTEQMNKRFADAYKKQEELCRQQKAK